MTQSQKIQSTLDWLNESGRLRAFMLDHTTGRPIRWCTGSYPEHRPDDEMLPEDVTGDALRIRAEKQDGQRSDRTRRRAEVFTPVKIVKQMVDCIDKEWFERDNPFGTEKAEIPEGKHWGEYINTTHLEITCGEAPFLTTRYHMDSGEYIPVEQRTGILDHKLRLISENIDDERFWEMYAYQACQSTYGYEYQGDSLLIARTNILLDCREHKAAKFGNGRLRNLDGFIDVITWNLWQMDGMTNTLPGTDTRCKIYDWREDRAVEFGEETDEGVLS